MLSDRIHNSSTSPLQEATRLMPFGFAGEYMPVSLNVDEVFPIKGHVPLDLGDMSSPGFVPRRCVYIDEIDHYLILDIAEPSTAMLYLVSGKTHEIVTSYTYLVETCPNYTLYDEITDMCVHHEDTTHHIDVSFLICNSYNRSASIARYRLEFAELGQEFDADPTNPRYHIKMSDLRFFANLIAPGKPDEIALGYTLKTASAPGHSWVYPEPIVSDITNVLKASFLTGVFNTKYCNIAIDEAGRYVVLIGSRIKVWAGPHLPFYADIQYIVVLDKGGMNIRFAPISGQTNCMSFDEGEEHQPYKYSMTIIDGRYLLTMEDRKSRFLNPEMVPTGNNTEGVWAHYLYSDKDWNGGAIADKYYPARVASSSPPGGGSTTHVGYPSKWQETSNPEPIERESVWTIIDICELISGMTPQLPMPVAPYQADVVFLVDTSSSMAPHIMQVQNNIKNFMSSLQSLGVTDIRVGVSAYTQSQVCLYDTSGSTLAMWTSALNGAQSMTDQLKVGMVNAGQNAWHSSAIQWAASHYRFRDLPNDTRYIVLITDSAEESDITGTSTAIATANKLGIKICVATNQSAYFTPMILQTNGTMVPMSGAWGASMAIDLAEKIAFDAGARPTDAKNWWEAIARAWQPTILYQYTPSMDYNYNSFLTMYHDAVSYISNGHIYRNSIDYLTIYDDYPSRGGRPQDSLYCPGLIPGEDMHQTFLIRNESYTGTMKKLNIQILDKPADVNVTITGFPEELQPREMVQIGVDATYNPSNPQAGTRHLDIHYKVTYWMQHVLSCRGGGYEFIEPAPIMPTYDLYFVEDTQMGHFAPGLSKQIAFDPLYTIAYTTEVKHEEGNAAKQQEWNNTCLYVLSKYAINSKNYINISPGHIRDISGYNVAETGCCWLKARGPLYWETNRAYELKTNTKTWYIVNQSNTITFVGHVDLDPTTVPIHNGTGFLVVEYPEGNIIKPGQSVPVKMYWKAIFDPAGEEMTHKVTKYTINNASQEGATGTIWDHNPAFFNHIIYNMPENKTAKITHLLSETITGDGMDIQVKPDQPLNKFDIKLITDEVYETQTYLDVDLDTVPDRFNWLIPAGIWGGIRDDSTINDVEIPAGTDPDDMFDYVEWLSPASDLPILPAYIDHKFKPNPDYLFNAESQYPYQLTPFNKEYADPYMATLFVGNNIVESTTISHSMVQDLDKYDDTSSELVPCDSGGSEKAGWMLDNFWPVAGDLEGSIHKLATENDYIFTRKVYVKNKGIRTIPVKLLYGSSTLAGISIQDVTITRGETLAPGAVAELEISFRLHYTYQESKHINMVKEVLYIPRFEVPLTV